MTLVAGVLLGVCALIALLGRADRRDNNGCFYTLLVGMVGALALVIVLGTQ
jgi:uncharacterized membrane protein YeaQ/YmgE (transglycosylase-associated protein family)